ncbi:hypothetical protein [Halorussus caseinilyticus]|uniref:Uncharacterized protein n=1 Tax=Halorussus caseinilyticus TaxID=3034025 RepID=A0ABD5WLK1_9EURY|nr:hypothetical protein [Halorussus sp. DT72]
MRDEERQIRRTADSDRLLEPMTRATGRNSWSGPPGAIAGFGMWRFVD